MNVFTLKPRGGHRHPQHQQRDHAARSQSKPKKQAPSLHAVQDLLRQIAATQRFTQKKPAKRPPPKPAWQPPHGGPKSHGGWEMVPQRPRAPKPLNSYPVQRGDLRHAGAIRVLDERQLPIYKRPVRVWMMALGSLITAAAGFLTLNAMSSSTDARFTQADERMNRLGNRVAAVSGEVADGLEIVGAKLGTLENAHTQLSDVVRSLQQRATPSPAPTSGPEQWATAAAQAATTGRCTELNVYLERIRASVPAHPVVREAARYQRECAAVARAATATPQR